MNNECIPFYEPGGRLTGHASAAVTGKRFLRVSGNRQNDIQQITDSVGGGNIQVAHATQYGRVIGVSSYDAAINTKVGVLCDPGLVVPVTAEGAISAFEEVMVGATGKATAFDSASAAVAATLATGVVGNNNALTWTAQDAGEAGNGISVCLRDPAGNNQSLSVTVSGNDIVVNLATGAGGAITSTAADVDAAIAASAAANSLVAVANTGASTGAGVVVAVAATNLSGGLDEGWGVRVGVCLTAVADGEDAQIKLY